VSAPTPPAAGPRFAARFAERRAFIILIAALATLGPFSMDTFLPSLPDLQASLGASRVQAQQALAAYLLGFGLMSLWHGAISDSIGRRPVILAGLAAYVASALACMLAPSIEVLIAARLVQGLFGGAGSIVSRAIVRDCFEGAQAQRLMSSVTLLFSVAPALAPILGGYLQDWFGWRGSFGFMFAGGLAILAWTWFGLPETHPPSQRAPLHVATLAAGYLKVFTRAEFQLLAGALTCNFATFFLYASASPAFIMEHLHLKVTDFGWFFVPVVAGMMLGAGISGRLAGRLSHRRTAWLGFAIMGAGVAANLVLQQAYAPGLRPGLWLTVVSILPLALSAAGQSMTMPAIQLLMMDLYPSNRGLVASCQGFTQVMFSAAVSGLAVPLVSDTAAHLAMACAAFYTAGLAFWMLYARIRRR
jgi:DHA1 family bicyclomycin/chloramphenicol resistance-like MFS transporter